MAEVILTEFQHRTDRAVKENEALIASLTKLDAVSDKTAKDVSDSYTKISASAAKAVSASNSTVSAYKQQEGVLGRLRFSINQLTAAREKSNSPALIQRYNRLIDEQNAKLKQLTTSEQKSQQVRQARASAPSPSLGAQFASFQQLGAGLGVALGTQTLVSELVDARNAASDYNEEFSKSGEIFGTAQKQVQDFADAAAQNIGQSRTEALQGASTFGIFGRAAGLAGDDLAKFSTDFVALASDLASFNNSTPEEATLAIGAALRGESEPIRRFGVLLDEATLKNEALKLGLISTTKEALTPQQRVLAAQAAIYKQTTTAQGDFARTSDGVANQQRILAAQYENVQIAIGQKLLPATLDLTRSLNSLLTQDYAGFLDNLDKFEEKVNPLGVGIGSLISAIDNLNDAFSLLRDGDYSGALERIGVAVADIFTATNPAIGAVRLLGQELGVFDEELSSADEALQRNIAINNTWQNALVSGGEALEEFYRRANAAYGITRDQFDKYVTAERAKLKVDKEDIEQTKEKITYLQGLNKELAELTSKVQNQVAQGGVVKQADVDRIIELQDGIKQAADEYAKLIHRTKDRTGFNASVPVTVEATGFDVQPAADYAQELIEINDDAGAAILARFIADEERKREELEKTKQKQIEDAAFVLEQTAALFGAVNTIVNASYQNRINRIDSERDAEIALLEASTLSEEEKAAKKDAIDKRAARKEYEIQKKQFETNKALSIVQTIINTAASVVAQLANPVPFVGIALAAVAAATGAAQIAVISSQKPPSPPSFRKGTPYLKRGNNPKGVDTIPVMADEGEAIIPAAENARYPGLAQAWISGNLEKYAQKQFAAPIIEEGRKKLADINRQKMAEAMAVTLTGGKFDDRRLLGGISESNEHLRDIAESLKKPGKRRG